jgi:NADPH-dependent 2,4-dienoyl-CoA reductase/sulfur reductase-like enzyme
VSLARAAPSGGRVLEADIVVVGVGVTPQTSWLEGSGLRLADGIVCDAALNAGVPGVYAAGDAASWHNELFGRRMRVEHWTSASEQGRHAALELLHGTAAPFAGSNDFWSDQYGVRIQFVGSAEADAVVVVDGSVDELRFVAWYRAGDRLVGALGVASAKLLLRSRAGRGAGLVERGARRGLRRRGGAAPGVRGRHATVSGAAATCRGRGCP